ncbi:shwachman-bodian-diamond syndrome [Fusarium agapanthi]|uniref:Shwachman-bodian-diamond syndrome n=1 Tax=Fusarium agapanthi TaxID=1803897 RepID=A0A9P5B5J6_9HYPO|nr:shwachman-bodian-diamond syndrome [Fusarium agapanthi]
MARGETQQTKVHYKGSDDFIIFIDDVETYQKWKSDKSIPLAHFISSFKIFLTHNQGVHGSLDAASKAALENEFGTSVDDDVIKQILEKGDTQTVEFPERQGPKNDSKGPMISH